MIKIPETYADWVACFDILKTGNNTAELLACMKQGTLEWSAGVAERFAVQLHATIDARLQAASRRFSRSMQQANGDQHMIVGALLGLRKEYMLLIDLCRLSFLPDEYSQQLVRQLRQQADAAQKSLEDSAKTDRTGWLASMVKKNRVNNWS